MIETSETKHRFVVMYVCHSPIKMFIQSYSKSFFRFRLVSTCLRRIFGSDHCFQRVFQDLNPGFTAQEANALLRSHRIPAINTNLLDVPKFVRRRAVLVVLAPAVTKFGLRPLSPPVGLRSDSLPVKFCVIPLLEFLCSVESAGAFFKNV